METIFKAKITADGGIYTVVYEVIILRNDKIMIISFPLLDTFEYGGD